MARTFTLRSEPTPNHLIDLLGETAHTIHADPTTTKLADGRTATSIGFPLLYISGWTGEPEAIGAKLVELLNEAGL